MISYEVNVKTGDKKGAGTDANVQIVLTGASGQQTKSAFLNHVFTNNFERGQVDVFTFEDEADIPEVQGIRLRRDEFGLYSDWYVETVEVINKKSGKKSVFPVLRWIRPNVDVIFERYDTSLPQFDPHPEQRNAELQEKQKLYEYSHLPGLPAGVKNIPDDELLSDHAKWDLNARKYKAIAGKAIEIIFGTGSWETLDDLKGVYSKIFREPKGMETWDDDLEFAWQRINGLNPNLIKLCTEIPNKFGVTEEMIKTFLEGLTLSQAITDKRLFIIDLEILVGISVIPDGVCPAPLALFFVDSKGQLKPVAIQLFQEKGPDNPVFLPSDPSYTWLMAKMWYHVADASYHHPVTHLGMTHLVMEGIAVAMNRCISPSHPVFKLLSPHFLYILPINRLGLEGIRAPGGWMDRTMVMGSKGAIELIGKGTSKWRMNVDGNYPENLKERGLYSTDGKILPTFYQRDDSLQLYEVIRRYVSKYVNMYYDTAEKLSNDTEIQNFGRELSTPQSEGGCGILGVPNDGKFESNDQLVLVFTCVIFTSSVTHSAVNFPMYDTYAFPPNCPMLMRGTPPKDKTPLTEKDIVASLADKSATLDTMIIASILSEGSTNNLGNFEVNYVYDPRAIKIVDEFREDLKTVSANIHKRNDPLVKKYEILLPESIPNSISI